MMLFIFVLCLCLLEITNLHQAMAESCTEPLGIEDKSVLTENLAASSEWNSFHGSQRARLNTLADSSGTGAWSALYNDQNQWIQVDLISVKTITGVITQGRNRFNQWVTAYEVFYSVDNNMFDAVTNSYGQVTEFPGNFDQDTLVTNMFTSAVYARIVRIHPTNWHSHISLRFEILGCAAAADVMVHAAYFKSSRTESSLSNTELTRHSLVCALQCIRIVECKAFKNVNEGCIHFTFDDDAFDDDDDGYQCNRPTSGCMQEGDWLIVSNDKAK
ncbi:retinoschisin-like isoform X2 [Antedon mediterranea]